MSPSKALQVHMTRDKQFGEPSSKLDNSTTQSVTSQPQSTTQTTRGQNNEQNNQKTKKHFI